MLVHSSGADCCGTASSTVFGQWFKKLGSDDGRDKTFGADIHSSEWGYLGGGGGLFYKGVPMVMARPGNKYVDDNFLMDLKCRFAKIQFCDELVYVVNSVIKADVDQSCSF